MAERGIQTIVAVTTEDDRLREVRKEAIERALREHATLILYDLTAGEDPLESPGPTEWSAEGTAEGIGDRLGPDELEAAGRAAIAQQVQDARDRGLDAWGWLPGATDEKTLLAYAADQPDPLVLMPPGDLADVPGANVQIDVVGDDS
jgi:hypothetical protein